MAMKDEIPRSVVAQYATREEWRNNSRNKEETESKQKQNKTKQTNKQTNTQLWTWHVMEVKSNAVKSNIIPTTVGKNLLEEME